MPRGGALGQLSCSGLTGTAGTWRAPEAGPAPFRLAGFELQWNGAHAPILSVFLPTAAEVTAGASQRIVFQVPLERNAATGMGGLPNLVPGRVRYSGADVSVTVAFDPASFNDRGPGGWYNDSNGYLLAEHTSDGSPVTHANPARAGETISVFANDFFTVWPPPPIGVPVPPTPRYEFSPDLSSPLTASGKGYDQGRLFLQPYDDPSGKFCASTPAVRIVYQGLAVGKIGVQQVDFVVPAKQTPGDWPLFFHLGSAEDGTRCQKKETRSSEFGLLIVR